MSSRIRTARHVADAPDSNTGGSSYAASIGQSDASGANDAGWAHDESPIFSGVSNVAPPPAPQGHAAPQFVTHAPAARQRIMRVKILPEPGGTLSQRTSAAQLAQILMRQANDPSSELRTAPGLRGVQGALLVPKGKNVDEACAPPWPRARPAPAKTGPSSEARVFDRA